MISPINPGHGHRCAFIERRIPPLNITIDESPILLQSESCIIIKLSKNELLADIFRRLASELLEALQLQCLLSCNALGRVEFQHLEDDISDLFVAISQQHLHWLSFYSQFLD